MNTFKQSDFGPEGPRECIWYRGPKYHAGRHAYYVRYAYNYITKDVLKVRSSG
jgi:hypothetical protein